MHLLEHACSCASQLVPCLICSPLGVGQACSTRLDQTSLVIVSHLGFRNPVPALRWGNSTIQHLAALLAIEPYQASLALLSERQFVASQCSEP